MANKFSFGGWIYNPVGYFSPDEIDVWSECGFNMGVTEHAVYGKDNFADMIPLLDRAYEKGIRMYANVSGIKHDDIVVIGDEECERRVREICSVIGDHPALAGFFAGDEPGTYEAIHASERCMRIMKKVAPHLQPYLNITGNSPKFSREVFGGKSFPQWLEDITTEINDAHFSFSQYNQMVDSDGITDYFNSIKGIVEHAEKTGFGIWSCGLLSAHYNFRIPTEYDIMWQITTAAALGCKGVFWFRFYDRAIGPNYHGSPVDEYGNKTEQYYRLLRCQRRFNDHYGEIIMSLKRKSSYFMGTQRGDYPMFGANTHPYVTAIKAERDAIVSFFEDESGKEYMVLVNASQTKDGVFKIYLDKEKSDLVEVLFNGKQDIPYAFGNGKDHWDGQWLYPGQMCMFRIDKK